MAVLQQHVHNDPPLLRDRQPEVSSALEALVGQLLSKRADGRPASADEVEHQLTRILKARDEAGAAATATLLSTGPALTATLLATEAPETGPVAHAATRPYPTAPWPPDIADPGSREVRHGSAKIQPRLWWLLAAALVAGVLLAAAVLTPLLSRSGEAASGQSSPGTPSTPMTPSTAPATSASPKSTPQVSPTGQPTSPLANVRAVVDSVVADGQMDPKRADEFGHRLDDAAKKPDHGNKGAGKQIDELSKYLTKLVKSGELTPDGSRRIEAALARV